MQIRITKSEHADIPNGTVGTVIESAVKGGWAVEVENKRTGGLITIFVATEAGEELPDMSGKAEEIIFIQAMEKMATKEIAPFAGILLALALDPDQLASAFVAIVHHARALGMNLPKAVITLLNQDEEKE